MSELRIELGSKHVMWYEWWMSKHVWKYGMGEKVFRTSFNPSSGLDRSLWNGYVAMTCGSCGPASYSTCSICIWGKPFPLTCLFHGAIGNSLVWHCSPHMWRRLLGWHFQYSHCKGKGHWSFWAYLRSKRRARLNERKDRDDCFPAWGEPQFTTSCFMLHECPRIRIH